MIYLDNNATTRVLPEIMQAMLPFYTEMWGNPSSLHSFGAQVAPHIDNARQHVAHLLQAQRESEIVFTSGGTESNNLAIRGVLRANPTKRHIITTQVEHPSILMLCQQLEKEGFSVTFLGVSPKGDLNIKEFENAIREDTGLASVLWANNETGVIFPIEEIANICQVRGVILHGDATQAVGKIAIDLRKIPINLLSISGHKFHAPKGIGALYVRRGTLIKGILFGGHQERSLRAGTENVAGIVGLGKACELANLRISQKVWKDIARLRDQLEQNILEKFKWVRKNGNPNKRLPNTSSLSFEGLDGETICLLLSEADIATSTGSACSAGSLEPSHVLKAMGLSHQQAKGTIRFSLSFETTRQEIEQTTLALEKILLRLKRT